MTTKEQNIQYQLNEWCKEYDIDPEKVKWHGYADLGEITMGACTQYPQYCTIELASRWENRKLGWLEMSVLWHEMAHAIAYLEDMVSNGHDDHWKKLRNSKPKYLIGDCVAKLVFSLL